MTAKEIRERLKHIAGLCYGLSADLQVLQDEQSELQLLNDGLEKLIKAKENELRKIRAAVRSREYAAKKKAENPEKYREKVRQNNQKAKERKALKK